MGSLEGLSYQENRTAKARYMNPFFIGAILITSLTLIEPIPQALKVLIIGNTSPLAQSPWSPLFGGKWLDDINLLGTYGTIIRLIKDRAIVELTPFILGVALGGIIGVKLIKWIVKSMQILLNHLF